MTDLFGKDIDIAQEDLKALEDAMEDSSHSNAEDASVKGPLYKLKLEYSCESLYAQVEEAKQLTAGDFVIVPTRFGKDIAKVQGFVNSPYGVKTSDIVEIDRKASESDIKKMNENKEKEKTAFKTFQEKVAAHKLEMKLITTHYLLEEQKVLFFFSSEDRVDFRELVKDLVSVFKMRIELRQIGVRDESRITGGLGVCGRPYCCHSVSDKLRPVSIRMAKDQNLSLNSLKISGQCGRLLCCFSYEHDWYAEMRKKLPNEGVRFYYDGTNFRVIEVNPLTEMVKMHGEDGRYLEIPASRIKRIDNKWQITK